MASSVDVITNNIALLRYVKTLLKAASTPSRKRSNPLLKHEPPRLNFVQVGQNREEDTITHIPPLPPFIQCGWQRWKLALSMTSAGCNCGSRDCSNHSSNKSGLQDPAKVIGAKSSPCGSAAIPLTRLGAFT